MILWRAIPPIRMIFSQVRCDVFGVFGVTRGAVTKYTASHQCRAMAKDANSDANSVHRCISGRWNDAEKICMAHVPRAAWPLAPCARFLLLASCLRTARSLRCSSLKLGHSQELSRWSGFSTSSHHALGGHLRAQLWAGELPAAAPAREEGASVRSGLDEHHLHSDGNTPPQLSL